MSRWQNLPTIVLLSILVLASCASNKPLENLQIEKIDFDAPVSFNVIAAQGEIPYWLRLFLEGESLYGGSINIERDVDFAASYVFVIEERGRNLPALERWKNSFRVEQDFSQAVFTRMYEHLISESEGRPDYFYGNFYEAFLKKIASHKFSSAVVSDSFWLKVSFEKPDGAFDAEDPTVVPDVVIEEEFRYYMFTQIDRLVLRTELRAIFTDIRSEIKVEKFQANAIDRLGVNLFANF